VAGRPEAVVALRASRPRLRCRPYRSAPSLAWTRHRCITKHVFAHDTCCYAGSTMFPAVPLSPPGSGGS
jgi:hypothetical protein